MKQHKNKGAKARQNGADDFVILKPYRLSDPLTFSSVFGHDPVLTPGLIARVLQKAPSELGEVKCIGTEVFDLGGSRKTNCVLDVMAEVDHEAFVRIDAMRNPTGHAVRHSDLQLALADADMPAYISHMISDGEVHDAYAFLICDFDPFGKGDVSYAWDWVNANTGEVLECGARAVLFNAAAASDPDACAKQDVGEDLARFLRFFAGHMTDEEIAADEFLRMADRKARRLACDHWWHRTTLAVEINSRDQYLEGRYDEHKRGHEKLVAGIAKAVRADEVVSDALLDAVGVTREEVAAALASANGC